MSLRDFQEWAVDNYPEYYNHDPDWPGISYEAQCRFEVETGKSYWTDTNKIKQEKQAEKEGIIKGCFILFGICTLISIILIISNASTMNPLSFFADLVFFIIGLLALFIAIGLRKED